MAVDTLKDLGLITAEQLDEALRQQRGDRGVPLGELLLRKGLVSRGDLQTALARKLGYPMVDVQQFQADAQALGRVPHAVARAVQALPLMVRAARLVLAVEDPGDHRRIDAIERAAGCTIAEFFERYGEQEFRAGERRVIGRLLEETPHVLSTGGGAYMDPETRELLKTRALTVWLVLPGQELKTV